MTRVVLLKQGLEAKGGLEKATLRIAEAFAKKGCDVTIVTASQNCTPQPGIRIASFPIDAWLPHRKLQAWNKVCSSYIRDNPAEVVLGFDRTTHQTHIRAGNGLHAAYLQRRAPYESRWRKTSFALNPLHRTILRLEEEALRHSDLRRLIVNSAMVRDEAIEHYNINPSLIRVVHNGVEWSELNTHFQNWPSIRNEVAFQIGSDPAAFHFLFVGHEYGRKGLDAFLKGLSHLRTHDPRVIVIGRDKNIPAYRRLAARLGLENVYFLGPMQDLYRFYALADVAVIPSYYDPFANVTLEALAMGLFVVTSRHNGGHEVVEKDCGTTIDDLQDPGCMAASLALALQHPKTEESARRIRYSVRYLDYPLQLERFTGTCLA